MAIVQNDYVEGFEYCGSKVVKTKGWVNRVRTDGEYIYCDIQADDGWNGARGTILVSEYGKIKKLGFKERPQKKY